MFNTITVLGIVFAFSLVGAVESFAAPPAHPAAPPARPVVDANVVNTVDVNVSNTVDVNVLNTEANPVPVTHTDGEGILIRLTGSNPSNSAKAVVTTSGHSSCVSSPPVCDGDSENFTVPLGKTLSIESITVSVTNADRDIASAQLQILIPSGTGGFGIFGADLGTLAHARLGYTGSFALPFFVPSESMLEGLIDFDPSTTAGVVTTWIISGRLHDEP